MLAYVPTAAESPVKIANDVVGYFAGEGSVDIITRVSRSLPVVTSSRFLSRALVFTREFNTRRRLV